MSTANDLAVAYIGSVVPATVAEQELACNVAGNLFQLRLLESLRQNGIEPYVITFLPVPAFPRDPRILVRGGTTPRGGALPKGMVTGFVNVQLLKQITQSVAMFMAIAQWLRRERGKNRVILLYNVFSPHVIATLAARALFGGTAVAIVADLPHDLYSFRGLKGLLEWLDFKAQTGSLSKFDGLVVLTRQISDDFAPHVPSLILEGAVDAESIESAIGGAPHRKAIMFSGTLNANNGVDLLLEAFALIPDSEYELWIYGRGGLEQSVVNASLTDRRIRFFGFAPNSEILKHQREAGVLVNPRPSHRVLTRYTFPSKLIEYMGSGRPVVTTRLPGLPDEYHPYLILLGEETPPALAHALRHTLEDGCSDAIGLAARDFVLSKKSWNVQTVRLLEFLRRILSGSFSHDEMPHR